MDNTSSQTASNAPPDHLASDPSSEAITLQINGESKTCLVGTTIPAFLTQVGLNPKLIAIEYNGEILTQALWDDTTLQNNDRLEIVTIVGGG